jgi:PAS domain S-box-containing protein
VKPTREVDAPVDCSLLTPDSSNCPCAFMVCPVKEQSQSNVCTIEMKLLLIDTIPGIVCFKDSHGRWIKANAFTLQLFHLENTVYKGKTDLELAQLSPFFKDVFSVCKHTDHCAWIQRRPVTNEETIPCPDGSALHFEVTKVPLYNSDGSPKGLMVFGQDITARKQAENAIRQNEELLTTLIEAMPTMVCFKDGQGRLLKVNKFALELFGLTDVDYKGKADYELVDLSILCDDSLAACIASDEDAWQKGKPIKSEEVFLRPYGGSTTLDIIKIPLFHPNGQRKGLVVVGYDITDRKRIEQDLRHSESQVRTLIEQASDGIFMTDHNGYYREANSRSCTMLGYAREELLRMHIADLVSLEDVHQVYHLLNNHDLLENTFLHEWKFKCKDDTLLPVEISAKILPNGCLQGIVRDITERKQAEEALQRSNRQIFDILSSITDAFFALDASWRFTYLNKEAECLFAKAAAELIGKCFWDEYPEALGTPCYDNLQKASHEQQAVHYEIFSPIAKTWQDVHAYPTQNGLSVYSRNITKQKQVEADLRRKEQEFKTLVEHAYDIITRVDRDYRFLYINPVVEILTGIPPQGYIGKTHRELSSDETTCTLWETQVQRIFATGQSVYFDFSVPTPDGIKHFHTHFAPEFDATGAVESVLGILRDITERKHWETEMARFDRLNLVGEMAASIAHEVRNPMTTVRGFLQMLEQKSECSTYKSYFDIMVEELDRANSIITEFLSLAKNRVIELTPKNLNAIIKSIVPLLQADALVNNKCIYIELEEIPDLLLDEKEIRQLLFNIARNGLEAMPPGGTLTIHTFSENNEIVLALQDQGSGIPQEILEKLGTPFFTTKETGTGLGLAVCYSIASRHNAVIRLETGSTGTTFYVRFNPTP